MNIELAGLIIDIKNPGEYTIDMCKDYMYNGEKNPDIIIEDDPQALEKERKLYPDATEDYYQNICNFYEIGGLGIKKTYSGKQRPIPQVESLVDLFSVLYSLNCVR